MIFRKKIILTLIGLVAFSSIGAQNLTNLNVPENGYAGTKDSVNKKGFHSKVGYKITQLMSNPKQVNTVARSNSLVTKDQSKVQVYIKTQSVTQNDLSQLEKLDFEIEIVNEKLNKVQGWVSLNSIDAITRLDNVISVTSPVYGHSKVGSRTTEGDAILRSSILRNQGITGSGVRVGIISDGSAGLSAAQASGDLPSNVTQFSSCIVGFISGCSEGTAMAEIIHDIAPDAELAIADALTTSLEFIQRLDQLANDFNADIIVDDLGFFGEPVFEDGDIAQAVTDLPENIVYVSAAGNSGDQHYQGTYANRTSSIFGGFGNADIHNFGLLRDNEDDRNIVTSGALPITVTGGIGQSCVLLQWNDPFVNGIFAPVVNDYDLFVFDDERDFNSVTLVGSSEAAFNTVEQVCFDNPLTTTTYYVVVLRFSGSDASELKVFTTGSAFPGTPVFFGDTQPGPEGSIFGHPATERAIAVGTINAQEPGNDEIAVFSSQGPSLISFPTPQLRSKPDITGIDGVSVTGSAGFTSAFFGTSAAAPHIAGIAALLKSANPDATADEIRNALINGADDLGTAGIDNVYGSGRANAEGSLELLPDPIVSGSGDGFDILDFLPAILDAAQRRN